MIKQKNELMLKNKRSLSITIWWYSALANYITQASFLSCAICKMKRSKSSTLSWKKSRFAQPFGRNWTRGWGGEENLKRLLALEFTQRNANHCFLWSLKNFTISEQRNKPQILGLIVAYLPHAMQLHCLHGLRMLSSPKSI